MTARKSTMSGQKLNLKTKKFQIKTESKKISPEWKGVSLVEVFKGRDRYDYQELPPIEPSSRHKVLFAVSKSFMIFLN